MSHLFSGVLTKMMTENTAPINYYLLLNDQLLSVNQLIGHQVKITHQGYECLSCGSAEKIYRMGHCKSCFFNAPSTAEWIIRPELSTAHLDKEHRDLDYEKKVQLQPHIVYLSYTGGVKVGVTRKSQIPTRWIDQGAQQAISIIETPNRYLAGIAEVALKEHFKDKTHWKKMLLADTVEADLIQEGQKAVESLPEELKPYIIASPTITMLQYPQEQVTVNNTINLEKMSEIASELIAIKGQYWLFKDGQVINIRSHEGYRVDINFV